MAIVFFSILIVVMIIINVCIRMMMIVHHYVFSDELGKMASAPLTLKIQYQYID